LLTSLQEVITLAARTTTPWTEAEFPGDLASTVRRKQVTYIYFRLDVAVLSFDDWMADLCCAL
jgi:hypothetical protein